jgi:hypothetical protein
MTNQYKAVNSKTLKRLIDTAKVLNFNQYPEKSHNFSTNGIHVLEMVVQDHKGHTNKDIIHHRASVLANVVGSYIQLYGKPKPVEFLLDIRDEDWNNLVDAKAMADSAKELNV